MVVAERVLASQPTGAKEILRELTGRSAPVALARDRLLPLIGAIAPMFPDGGLRRGSVVGVSGSLGLTLAVIAGPSQAGAWCAAVGIPSLGLVAAAEAGVDLARFPLVASPVKELPTIVAALLDAFDVVLVRMPGPNRRLEARARERGAVLVVDGPWPGADVRLTVASTTWEGLGDGHGHLVRRRLQVVATGRGAATRERKEEVWLPSAP
jgi:hypothetical protein